MTLLSEILQTVFLFAIFVACCMGAGAPLARWLSLAGAFAFPLGFACVSFAGFVAFFAWWMHPTLGLAVSTLAGLSGIASFAAQLSKSSSALRAGLRRTFVPLLLFAILAACYGVLLKAGGRPASERFTNPLPVDDQLPRFFAEKLAAGQSPTPLAGDWLSSDRPPLQAGITLLFRPFVLSPTGWAHAYQAIGMLCQLMWVPALVSLAHAIRLERRATAAGLFAAATSGFFAINSIYVWPKLCAAALVITALAILVERARAHKSLSYAGTGATGGAIAALATMAHGGAMFSILAIPALPAAWRALSSLRPASVLAAAVCFVAVVAPWSAYKKFFDPPGNRLVKWHIGGVIPIDDKSTWRTIRDSYASKTVPQHLERWRLNLIISTHLPGRMDGEVPAAYARRAQFFNYTPAVGIPVIGAVWLLVAARLRGGEPLRIAGGLILYSIATVLLWTGLMFIPLSSVVHQGSYVPVALMIFLGAAAFGVWPRWIGIPLLMIHAAFFIWAWVATTPPKLDGSVATSSPWLLAIAAVLLGAFALALRALAPDATREPCGGSTAAP